MTTPAVTTPAAQPSGCLPSLLTRPVWAVVRRLAGLAAPEAGFGRGVALRGAVWVGGDPAVFDGSTFDGVVVVGNDGRVAAIGPSRHVPLPEGLAVVDCAWIGPGVTDAHVHLSVGVSAVSAAAVDGGALVAVRDLGSPAERILAWRGALPLVVVGSGPVVVGRAAGGAGPAVVDGPSAARRVVAALVAQEVDLVEVRVGSGTGPPDRAPAGVGGDGLRAVVGAAHDAGLPVVAHAPTAAGVAAALAAGVDEFAQVPIEALSQDLVERVAEAGVPVVSTLQRHAAAGAAPARNAAELHRAGVRLIYGTDGGAGGLGAGGAGGRRSGGVDPRELDRLAYAGLGRLGALRAATSGAAQAAGLAGRAPSGRIEVGARAALVGLYADPLVEPAAWRAPAIVVRGTALTTG